MTVTDKKRPSSANTQSSSLSTQHSSQTSLLTSHSSLKPTRWIVTGGCGFIGRNLIKKLIEEGGHYVRIIDNLSVGSREDLAQTCNFTESDPSRLTSHSSPSPQSSALSAPRSPQSSVLSTYLNPQHSTIELIPGDILDPNLAIEVTKGVDVIVHLAANTGVGPSVENPRMDCEVNVMGIFNYLEAARQNKIKRFIFASSGAPIGECIPPIHEELAPHPVSPYGASKLAGEGYCSAYYRTFGVETVALRFGNVYGPLSSNKSSIVAKFIKQAMIGEICEIYGDGTQTRDFIYIDDLVDAIYKAATLFRPETQSSALSTQSSVLSPQHSVLSTQSSVLKPQPSKIGGETFQIATSKEHTVNEVSEMIKLQLKQCHNIDMQIKYGQPRLGDVSRNFSDTSKAMKMLGWRSTTHLDEGIKTTIDWFMNQHNS